MPWVCLLIVRHFIWFFYGMLRSTWCLLYLTFYTFVVLVSAVVQAPVLFGAWTTVAIVIRSAFVERIETPGIARGHHRKVVWSFSILRENSQNWNQCDKQDKFHHVLGSVSLFAVVLWFCRIKRKENLNLNKSIDFFNIVIRR